MRAVRTDEWLFIERFGHSTRPPANIDDGAAKTLLLKNPDYLRVPQYQLYHIIDDPNEQKNLAGDPRHAAKVRELRAALHKHMRETDDPLVKGWPVPLGQGKSVAGHSDQSVSGWLKGQAGTNNYTVPEDKIYPFEME